MKSYQVEEYGKPLVCNEGRKPTPTGYEVLARTIVTGVCHTDVHVAAGDLGRVNLPLTPGHEGVGIVEAVGPDVKTMKVGDRIGVPWLGTSCMQCDLCKAGRQNLCETQKQTGFVNQGTFSEYFLADERFSVKIPKEVKDAEAAPVLCAGVTSYKALRMANVSAGQRVVISGACGGLGHMAIQYAKAMGLEVIALDMIDDGKREMLKMWGADFVVDLACPKIPLIEKFKSIEPRKPIDAAVIFAPAIQAVTDAMDYVSPGATIVTVALPAGEFKIDVVKFILKELRLQASIVGTPKDLEEAFKYVAEGKVKACVEVKPFDKVNEILKDLEEGRIRGRIVLQVSNAQ